MERKSSDFSFTGRDVIVVENNYAAAPKLNAFVHVKISPPQLWDNFSHPITSIPHVGELITVSSDSLYRVLGVWHIYRSAQYDIELYVEPANQDDYLAGLRQDG
jgi:hypothetical protein